MERFAPQLTFDLPSSSLNFDTFSKLPLPVVNTERNNSVAMVEATAAEKLLRKLSEQIGRGLKSGGIIGGVAGVGGSAGDSSLSSIRNQIVLNGTGSSSVEDFNEFPSEDWIRQAEYDKFMNEIWIGIVLTLIVISMVFCICSCFLYHQFRQWKNNYHRNIQQNNDMESVKLSIEDDDLPNYTLVSGLPSYDAALEQLQRSATSNSCLLLYPSVFKIFASNEKQDNQLCPLDDVSNTSAAAAATTTTSASMIQQYRNSGMPAPTYQEAMSPRSTMTKNEEAAAVPSYQEALLDSSGISNS